MRTFPFPSLATVAFVLGLSGVGCGGSSTTTPPPTTPPQTNPGTWNGPPPQQGWAQPPGQAQAPQGWQQTAPTPTGWPAQQQGPTTQPTVPQPTQPAVAQRPLLAPLLGSPAWRAEVKLILDELIANLQPSFKPRVQGIPLQFENNPADINAFAGCDDKGAPFMAATEGILILADSISQTRANDELFGTHTYEQFAAAVVPSLVTSETAIPALPPNIISPQSYADLRRLSRAHEIFQEVMGFTMSHELAHHYLGHTGCANGPMLPGMAGLAGLGNLVTQVAPVFNQGNEYAADNVGVIDLLDTGRARQATAYRWTENGGYTLLDFFGRMAQAAGAGRGIRGYLGSHPPSEMRIGWVRTFAAAWYALHR